MLLPYIEDLVPCSIPQSFYMEVLECVSVCGGRGGGLDCIYDFLPAMSVAKDLSGLQPVYQPTTLPPDTTGRS